MMYTRRKYTYKAHLENLIYHFYQSETKNDKKLLLLHGSRLGGVETWEKMIRSLKGWSEIIVPDLPGVGKDNPINKTANDFTLHDVLDALLTLTKQHRWKTFNIVGYSYGGFIAKKFVQKYPQSINREFLIESALLAQTEENLTEIADRLDIIAEQMHTEPEIGNKMFSELVAKKSVRNFALKSNTRPISNPLGFANSIYLLNQEYRAGQLWKLLDTQKNVSTLLARPLNEGKQNLFAQIIKRYSWKIVYMDDVDHSLIFTHPKDVANILTQWITE